MKALVCSIKVLPMFLPDGHLFLLLPILHLRTIILEGN
jgi:hypothetical protein